MQKVKIIPFWQMLSRNLLIFYNFTYPNSLWSCALLNLFRMCFFRRHTLAFQNIIAYRLQASYVVFRKIITALHKFASKNCGRFCAKQSSETRSLAENACQCNCVASSSINENITQTIYVFIWYSRVCFSYISRHS